MYGVVSKNMSFAKQALYLKQTGITRKEHMFFSFTLGNQFANSKKKKLLMRQQIERIQNQHSRKWPY